MNPLGYWNQCFPVTNFFLFTPALNIILITAADEQQCSKTSDRLARYWLKPPSPVSSFLHDNDALSYRLTCPQAIYILDRMTEFMQILFSVVRSERRVAKIRCGLAGLLKSRRNCVTTSLGHLNPDLSIANPLTSYNRGTIRNSSPEIQGT